MNVVEYQVTKKELFFEYLWLEFKRPRTCVLQPALIMLCCVVSIRYDIPFLSWLASFYILFVLFIIMRRLYVELRDPEYTSRRKLVFGDDGIIVISARMRTERTWGALHSWSQSRDFIFLYVNNVGTALAIPKRAFKGEQMSKFLKLLHKIDSENYLHSESPLHNQSSLKTKDALTCKLFLSYAREDITTAMRLFDDLSNAGMDVWFDRESLLAGQNWKAAVEQAIRESRFFLALLSSNSVSKKGYVQKELKHAFEILDEYPKSAIFIIPVRLDNCNPTDEMLQELHWIDIFDNWDEGLARIAKTLHTQNLIKNL